MSSFFKKKKSRLCFDWIYVARQRERYTEREPESIKYEWFSSKVTKASTFCVRGFIRGSQVHPQVRCFMRRDHRTQHMLYSCLRGCTHVLEVVLTSKIYHSEKTQSTTGTGQRCVGQSPGKRPGALFQEFSPSGVINKLWQQCEMLPTMEGRYRYGV